MRRIGPKPMAHSVASQSLFIGHKGVRSVDVAHLRTGQLSCRPEIDEIATQGRPIGQQQTASGQDRFEIDPAEPEQVQAAQREQDELRGRALIRQISGSGY